MPKPITETSANDNIWEEGNFSWNDPFKKKTLQKFANMKVYQGVDEKGNMILVGADRPMLYSGHFTRHTAWFSKSKMNPRTEWVWIGLRKDARSYENNLNSNGRKE